MSQDTIEFRKMTQEEFAKFHEDNLEGYAQDIARAFKRPIEGERVRAKEQVTGLLPKGVDTEGHYLFNAIDTKSGNKVGNVWINVDEAKSRAFLFDIVVYEPFRQRIREEDHESDGEDAEGNENLICRTTCLRLQYRGHQPIQNPRLQHCQFQHAEEYLDAT